MKLSGILTASVLFSVSFSANNARANDLIPEFLGPTLGLGHGHTYGGLVGLRLGLQAGRHEIGFGRGGVDSLSSDGPRDERGYAAYYRVNLWGFGGHGGWIVPTLTAGYGPSLWFVSEAMDGRPTGISRPRDYHGFYAQAGANICLGWFCVDVEYGPHSAFGENERFGNGLAPELTIGMATWIGDKKRRRRAWQKRPQWLRGLRRGRGSSKPLFGANGPFAEHRGAAFGVGVGNTYGGFLGVRGGRQFRHHELGLGLGLIGAAAYYRANLWSLELGPFRVVPTATAGYGPSNWWISGFAPDMESNGIRSPLDYHGFFAQVGANICVSRYCIDLEYGPHSARGENEQFGNGLAPELTVGVAVWHDKRSRARARARKEAKLSRNYRRAIGRRATERARRALHAHQAAGRAIVKREEDLERRRAREERAERATVAREKDLESRRTTTRKNRQGQPVYSWWGKMEYSCSPDDTLRVIAGIVGDPDFARRGSGKYEIDGAQVKISVRIGRYQARDGGTDCYPTEVHYRMKPPAQLIRSWSGKREAKEARRFQTILAELKSKLERGKQSCNFKACGKRKAAAEAAGRHERAMEERMLGAFSRIQRVCGMPFGLNDRSESVSFSDLERKPMPCFDSYSSRGQVISCVSELEAHIGSGKYKAPSTSSQRATRAALARLQREAQGESGPWGAACEEYKTQYKDVVSYGRLREMDARQFQELERKIQATQSKCARISPEQRRFQEGARTCKTFRKSLAKMKTRCWNETERVCRIKSADCRRSCGRTFRNNNSIRHCEETTCAAVFDACVARHSDRDGNSIVRCEDYLDY